MSEFVLFWINFVGEGGLGEGSGRKGMELGQKMHITHVAIFFLGTNSLNVFLYKRNWDERERGGWGCFFCGCTLQMLLAGTQA